MFIHASAFNQDIGSWNTATSDYYAMDVCYASAFNHDIGSWNTEKVTHMGSMFYRASAFNQDIGSWNTAQVTDYGIYVSVPLLRSTKTFPSWTGSAATSAQTNMFLDASAFQAKYTCGTSGPASSCNVIESTWIAPSPPPPSPPSPPPPPLTPIPSASWHDFVVLCLEEAPKNWRVHDWASGNNYGTMPNWDTSLVEDMSGLDGRCFSRLWR